MILCKVEFRVVISFTLKTSKNLFLWQVEKSIVKIIAFHDTAHFCPFRAKCNLFWARLQRSSCKAHTSNGSVQLLLLHFYCVFIAPSTVLHFPFTHQLNTSLLDQLLFTCSNSITVFQNIKSNHKECQKDFKCDPQNLGNS